MVELTQRRMALRTAFVCLLGISACAPASELPHARAIPSKAEAAKSAAATIEPVVAQSANSTTSTAVVSERASDVSTANAPLPALPEDGVCFVRGTGDPFSSRCTDTTAVTSGRDGSGPIGNVDLRNVDVTFGFLEGKGRSWMRAKSAGLSLTGFVDTKNRRFRLTSLTAAIPGHIWFREGAPVVVASAANEQIKLAVVGDMAGLDSLTADATCDNISFDPQSRADRRAVKVPTLTPKGGYSAAPRRAIFPIRLAPRGLVVATLTHDHEPVPLTVTVTEEEKGFARVVFDTEFTHFDVWVAQSELRTNGARGVGHGEGFCSGRTFDPDPASLYEVVEDTPVAVAFEPKIGVSVDGVSVARGALVTVQRRDAGFAEITSPFGAIEARAGAGFWVPETVLKHHDRAAQ